MRKIKFFVPILLVLMLVACAGVQEKWNALTPDEKARVVVSDIQAQLNTLFDTGKAYVMANPKYQDKWKGQIVPAFDLASKSLASATILAKAGKITPDQVYAQVQPVLNSVITLLISIGAVKPITAAVDVMVLLALINGFMGLAYNLWSTANKIKGDQKIPTWDEILDQNKLLQDKIDAEK